MAASNDVVCGECSKKIDFELKENVFCDKFCKKYFHKKCAGIGDTEFFFYADGGTKKFVCKTCRKKMVETRLSNKGASPTPTTSKGDCKSEKSLTVEVQIHPAPDVIDLTKGLQTKISSKSTEVVIDKTKTKTSSNNNKTIEKVSDKNQSYIKEIHTMMKDMKARQQIMEQKLTSFEDRHIRMENDLKEVNESCQSLKQTIDKLTQENSKLSKENEELRNNLDDCNFRINSLEQNNLLANIEVCGVPESKSENLSDVMNSICSVAQIELQAQDITEFYRKGRSTKSNQPRQIVVKFSKKSVKDKFMAKCKENRKLLNTGLFNNGGARKPIYINHQLTRNTSFLFMKCKKEIPTGKFMFVWISGQGKVLTRTSDRGKVQQIYNLNHLNDFISRH